MYLFIKKTVDGCYFSPCLNNGICLSDKYGSYNCNLNYMNEILNDFIQQKIADGCYSYPCLNGGTCKINAIGNYNCTCILGFYGVNCQFCKFN